MKTTKTIEQLTKDLEYYEFIGDKKSATSAKKKIAWLKKQ